MLTLDATHFKHVHVRNHTDTPVLTIARLSQDSAAVVLADATTISLAAPAMSPCHELQAHHGHVTILNRPRAGPALMFEVLV